MVSIVLTLSSSSYHSSLMQNSTTYSAFKTTMEIASKLRRNCCKTETTIITKIKLVAIDTIKNELIMHLLHNKC